MPNPKDRAQPKPVKPFELDLKHRDGAGFPRPRIKISNDWVYADAETCQLIAAAAAYKNAADELLRLYYNGKPIDDMIPQLEAARRQTMPVCSSCQDRLAAVDGMCETCRGS